MPSKYVTKTDRYEIADHPQTKRLYHVTFADSVIEGFLKKCKEDNITVERLEYTPLERHVIADYLLQEVNDKSFDTVLRDIVHDRASGGFTLGLQGVSEDTDEYVIFATAITHLIGVPNFDAMTGKYYARFTVKHTDDSDSYLRQAYRLFTLHTDGTFVDEPTDWLLMMKMAAENAVGGESRLLHLDDWAELDKYANSPLAHYEFDYIAPPSKNVSQKVKKSTFFIQNNRPCMCFIDQFVYPETIEQAKYLRSMSESMENDPSVVELELPVGELVVVNNLFWLHGRAAFEVNKDLSRELMRQRGRFIV